MNKNTRKSDLTPARKWLVEAMQRIGFGRIEHLVIIMGQPLIYPPPRLFRVCRIMGINCIRQEEQLSDFILKKAIIMLFEDFDRIGNGVIPCLEVRDGLPFNLSIEMPA